jgi:hypothetical protein
MPACSVFSSSTVLSDEADVPVSSCGRGRPRLYELTTLTYNPNWGLA